MKFAKPAFLLIRVGVLMAVVALLVAVAGKAMAQLRVDITQGTIQPMPIAIPPFVGAAAVRRAQPERRAGHHRRPEALRPLRSGRSRPPSSSRSCRRASHRTSTTGGHSMPRRWSPARVGAAGDGRIMAEFRLWDVVFRPVSCRASSSSPSPDNWRRLAHIIADSIYERLTGEKGYFDSRIAFVDETGRKSAAGEAPRDHGSGRRQRADADPAARPRRDAALLAVAAGTRLHDARRRRPARLSAQHRDRPAGAGRQLSRYDVRAALLARTAQEVILSLQQGGNANIYKMDLRTQADDAAYQLAVDRHRAVLLAGRHADRLRVRPRRRAAALHHGRRTAAARSASASGGPLLRRRSGRRAATLSPSPSSRGGQFKIGVMQPDGRASAS